MKKAAVLLFIPLFFLAPLQADAARIAKANRAVNTYLLLHEAFGGDQSQALPDCAHSLKHVTQTYDSFLRQDVFVFHSHVDVDNDRCIKFDRQRSEIGVHPDSFSSLRGTYGKVHTYRWKFRLNSQFQASSAFTTLFQTGASGADDGAGRGVLNLWAYAGSPDTINVGFRGNKVASASLDKLRGVWVEAYVKVKYANDGRATVDLYNMETGERILHWYRSNIDMWLWDESGNYMRPKWGVYRSLGNKEQLRDEHTLFNDICIAVGSDTCPSYFD